MTDYANNYRHPADTNLKSLHKVMEYDAVGRPILRVNSGTGNTYNSTGNVNAGTDAFGRLRVSQPFTLFDSSHRYRDNNLWNIHTAGDTATSTFNANAGLIEMTVGDGGDTADEVIRETTKVFSYQPGKSLLIMNTFCMAPAKTGLRQRVGYYGTANGMYLELDGTTLQWVERSSVTGVATESKITQGNWNVDPLDGTGASGVTLDITKAQIQWMDVEWLGLGSSRMGFVINGQFVTCHVFHHANLIQSTYISTASLPLRYEIRQEGAGGDSTTSTIKQVCSTVISEGGYSLAGLQQAVTTPIATPYELTTADTYYPVASIRLKASPDRLDAIVVLTALSFLSITNNSTVNWQLRASATTTGGSWVSAGSDSAVEYNMTGTSSSGGRILASGWIQGSNQGASAIDLLREALFKFQLERNTFTNTGFEFSLVAASDTATTNTYASLDWEEISR